jgi:hypothetical protein
VEQSLLVIGVTRRLAGLFPQAQILASFSRHPPSGATSGLKLAAATQGKCALAGPGLVFRGNDVRGRIIAGG